LLLGFLTTQPLSRLTAQVSFHVSVGARYTSTMVHDSIGGPFDVRPALAPALLVIVRSELKLGWSVDGSIDVSPSSLQRHETTGTFDAGTFTAIAFTIGLRREIEWGLSGRAGIGALKYAAPDRGLFREGSGGLFPIGTIAATYAPAWGARRRLAVETRYDFHRFITPAMRTQGFIGSRPIHRVALLVRLGWAPGKAPEP
jgi:hypothetical protein